MKTPSWYTQHRYGAESGSWPVGGITSFHGEKGTTWEGGFRVPQVVRWPGVIKPGTVYNEMISHEDWLPNPFCTLAGVPNVVEKLKAGYQANGKTWKVHMDGYDFLPFFQGRMLKNHHAIPFSILDKVAN